VRKIELIAALGAAVCMSGEKVEPRAGEPAPTIWTGNRKERRADKRKARMRLTKRSAR